MYILSCATQSLGKNAAKFSKELIQWVEKRDTDAHENQNWWPSHYPHWIFGPGLNADTDAGWGYLSTATPMLLALCASVYRLGCPGIHNPWTKPHAELLKCEHSVTLGWSSLHSLYGHKEWWSTYSGFVHH